MSPEDSAKLDVAARRWFFDAFPTDEVQIAQLIVYLRMENDLTDRRLEILRKKAQLYDDWLAAGLGLLESYANAMDSQ